MNIVNVVNVSSVPPRIIDYYVSLYVGDMGSQRSQRSPIPTLRLNPEEGCKKGFNGKYGSY
jgi:hypothetical protein